MSHRVRNLAMAILAGAGLAACATDTSSGKLGVQMTDAPFPYSDVTRADIFVVRIDAKSATTDSAEAANDAQMSGWTTIATPNTTINLLDLTGGKTTNLGSATLTTGTYRGFRMIIDASKSSLTLTTGTYRGF